METTTIAVKSETLKMLRKAKEDLNVDSFDMVIKNLLLEVKKPKRSMFGVLKGIHKEFKREELDRFG
ncbi:hypothetical protein J4234_03975 [Candidatus Woesearchaeota archaeon]|nr:hypothetical protein [Candidatus Woesearchaeota archaeon]